VYQDPMTGKEWTLIRDNLGAGGIPAAGSSALRGGIIGVVSKSEERPFRTDFKDTALENMSVAGFGATTSGGSAAPQNSGTVTIPVAGGQTPKYNEWNFVADTGNDHSKIYRAYHEGW